MFKKMTFKKKMKRQIIWKKGEKILKQFKKKMKRIQPKKALTIGPHFGSMVSPWAETANPIRIANEKENLKECS